MVTTRSLPRRQRPLQRLSALGQILALNALGGFLLALTLALSLPADAPPLLPSPVETDLPAPLPPLLLTRPAAEETVPEGMLPVSAIQISGERGGYEGAEGVYFQNVAGIGVDYAAALGREVALPAAAEGPQVLILHTHTSEAYAEQIHWYDPAASAYDRDNSQNIVAVGDTLAAALERRGIGVVHETTHCDDPSFNQAYNKSRTVAEAALAEHPSIRVVIDLHRDSMITAEGLKYRPVLTVDGVETAQMMLVVGSPKNGLAHPDWLDNLALAGRLYQLLEQETPGLMRPIHISANRYNQHLSPAAFLVEVGTCANTMAEADAAVELLAEGVAALLTEVRPAPPAGVAAAAAKSPSTRH